MLTSVNNARVKQIVQWQTKAKERKKDNIFIAEGLKMWEEAPEELLLEVYLTEDVEKLLLQEERNREKLQKTTYELVSKEVFAKMSDTCSPQGILCVLRRPFYDKELLLQQENPMFVILEDLQDPGNLGTIFRTGEGAGVTGIILNKGTVDLFNPKTIRSTMGSIYRVPFLIEESLEELLPELQKRGIHTLAAHLKGNNYFQEQSLTEPVAFLIGNEGKGLSEQITKLAGEYIKIPMKGKLESLNASVAASLLMYEAMRQRDV